MKAQMTGLADGYERTGLEWEIQDESEVLTSSEVEDGAPV